MYAKTKRLIDILLSALMTGTLLPLSYIILGILIKAGSKGPVIFRQMRTGLDGRPFVCYKFRSMYMNDTCDTHQAYDEDPRITRIGRIIRRLHADEIPQFYNVLKGDMSIIGPRPHMLIHTEEFSAMLSNYKLRHGIRPGITGLAQVMGYCGPVERMSDLYGRLKLDLWYMDHLSPSLDTFIMMRTFSTVSRQLFRSRQ